MSHAFCQFLFRLRILLRTKIYKRILLVPLATYIKMNNVTKFRILDLWVINFHLFGKGVDAEPCELENTPSRQLWPYKLRVKFEIF